VHAPQHLFMSFFARPHGASPHRKRRQHPRIRTPPAGPGTRSLSHHLAEVHVAGRL
jgi:hypothetical protein